MRKSALVLVIIFFAVVGFSQISTTKIQQPKPSEVPTYYDSTENFVSNPYMYIGQELYIPGCVLHDQGFDDFFIDYKKDTWTDRKNVYKVGSGFNTEYEALAQKYFRVLDVIKYEQSYPGTFLKLQEKESKDIIYYGFSLPKKYFFPFIVVGYFMELRRMKIGNKFVVRGIDWSQGIRKMVDVNTGKPPKNFKAGSTWTCVDVTMEDQLCDIVLNLENEIGEQILLPMDDINKAYFVFSLPYSDELKAKFGESDWLRIVSGILWLGMTKEMCEISWGKPDDINSTITSYGTNEQWVYTDNYLYFENGILVTMQ